MDPDLLFVVGIALLVLSFPLLVGAFAEGSPPRGGALLILIAAGLISVAVWQRPGTYSFEGIPDVFVRVISGFF
jgi:hypothetical protein